MTTGFLAGKMASVFRYAGRFCAAFGLLLSVGLAGASVAFSFFVPTKLLGVPVAAVGCFAAGWIFAAFLRKAIDLGSSSGDVTKALANQKEENERLANEVESLRLENRRLGSQRIDVNALRPVLKLGLMDAEMIVKDVKLSWMNDFSGEGLIESLWSATRSQYVGVLQRKFKATFGVDLAKLRVREEDGILRIAGVMTESLGLRDDESTWLLRQRQKYHLKFVSETSGDPTPPFDASLGFRRGERYYEINRDEPFEGNLDLNQTAAEADRQERELRDRINRGVGEEFRNVNAYISEMAEGFVRLLLSPTKKQIVFDPAPLSSIGDDASWRSLEEFAKLYNNRLEDTIGATRLLSV